MHLPDVNYRFIFSKSFHRCLVFCRPYMNEYCTSWQHSFCASLLCSPLGVLSSHLLCYADIVYAARSEPVHLLWSLYLSTCLPPLTSEIHLVLLSEKPRVFIYFESVSELLLFTKPGSVDVTAWYWLVRQRESGWERILDVVSVKWSIWVRAICLPTAKHNPSHHHQPKVIPSYS